MERTLEGKVVCVTGSARRVGREIALEFARAGANIAIHHHSSDEEAALVAQEARDLGSEVFVCKADQSDPDAVAYMFRDIHHHFGRLDIMVNSAANFLEGELLDIAYEDWQKAINVNLTGPWLCTQHAGRLMRHLGIRGVIINISDNSGLKGWKNHPHHSIAKAGVIMLTKVSAKSLGIYNIRVNCVIPGPVLQPEDESDENWARMVARLPLQRDGSPEDVARACLFLATNNFITGATLNVDGGESVG